MKAVAGFSFQDRCLNGISSDGTAPETRLKAPGNWPLILKNKTCRWHTTCYIANDLRYRAHQFNRRTRERIFFAAGVLSLALWLFMAAAEICTPLHAWLHGGTIPDNDDGCAIVAIAHGQFDLPACDLPVVAPAAWIEVTPPHVEFSIFRTSSEFLPLGRAPPALYAVS